MEMRKFNYVLGIDILRNSSQKNLGESCCRHVNSLPTTTSGFGLGITALVFPRYSAHVVFLQLQVASHN